MTTAAEVRAVEAQMRDLQDATIQVYQAYYVKLYAEKLEWMLWEQGLIKEIAFAE